MKSEFTYGSLFTGVGGLDLGLEWAGMTCRWMVEWEEYPREVLDLRWPDVPKYKDVHDVDPGSLEPVDLICGGFPCQPHSVAASSKRKGIEDDRWLWPEFFRIVSALRPRYVLVENVPGLLTVNDGRAIREVLGDLASCGYDAEWDVVPAVAFGAPQLRYRLFIVAYTPGEQDNRRGPGGLVRETGARGGRDAPAGARREDGRARLLENPAGIGRQEPVDSRGEEGRGPFGRPERSGACSRRVVSNPHSDALRIAAGRGLEWKRRLDQETIARAVRAGRVVAHANKPGLERHTGNGHRRTGRTEPGGHAGPGGLQPGEEIPDPPGIRGGRGDVRGRGLQTTARVFREPRPYLERGEVLHAVRQWWSTEPRLGRVAHGTPDRVDRLKAIGNAVVPAITLWIGRRILEWEKNL